VLYPTELQAQISVAWAIVVAGLLCDRLSAETMEWCQGR
jgi:hypothetical protein